MHCDSVQCILYSKEVRSAPYCLANMTSTNSQEEAEYAKLCKDRKYIRARVTRIYNQVTTQFEFESLTARKKADLTEKLHELKTKLTKVNDSIHSILPSTVDEAELILEEEEYEEKLSSSLSALVVQETAPPQIPERDGPLNINKLKLPTVSLPEYSNLKGESLEKFLFTFESIITKHGLSDYEKFIYLKGQLRKGPLSLVNSLEPAEQTYDSAKALLGQAFACPLTQKYEAIKRLCDLKLRPSDDVYSFISDMRTTVSLFKSLDINIDTVIQYFIWQGMNDSFQAQLVSITNKSKPSLEEINAHIFSATERYLKSNEHVYSKWKNKPYGNAVPGKYFGGKSNSEPTINTNNLAVHVTKKPKRDCMLCVADNRQPVDHSLKDCKRYPTPNDKIKKLDSLKYCSICAFTNHGRQQCKFKFHSSCRNCKKNHLTFLCPSASSTVNSHERMVAKTSVVHCGSSNKSDTVILPTFTIDITHNNESSTCRALYDTGSQRNFIHQEVAERLKLPVLKSKAKIYIQGINSEKVIYSNLVTVPLQVEGLLYHIEAIVLPRVEVDLSIEKLNTIAKAFISKGYTLADRALSGYNNSNAPSSFDFIMGPDAVKLLRPQTVSFGTDPNVAVFMQSRVGVLLLGEAGDLLRAVKDLPPSDDMESKIGEGSVPVDSKVKVAVGLSTVSEVLDENGEVVTSQLKKATDEALQQCTDRLMNYDSTVDVECSEVNEKLVNYVLTTYERTEDGRLIMPLPWNPECSHLLGRNFNLSKQILFSNLKKLNKDNKLSMYNDVFKEQERLGIIERIEDVNGYINNHPDCSFLPHMGVYRMSKETTKVRVVFLSNLCEKNRIQPHAVSHNNALLPGPCLNSKISTAVLRARFDAYIFIFDISKAFLNIELKERDQNKLLFLWFKNVDRNNFSLIAYKNLRLPFGLRPSPTILMLALYQMLIIDIDNDPVEVVQLKKLIYENIYVDNASVSAPDIDTLCSYYEMLPNIFSAYKFDLQQFACNDSGLQRRIDSDFNCSTGVNISFFGMVWNRELDTLGPNEINLNIHASTKREVLASLNGVYDLFGIYTPVLNRAKLFFQQLQYNKSLTWDTPLGDELSNEWRKICRQANATPRLTVGRVVGSKDSTFTLVAFSDASAAIYGVTVYLIDNDTKRISFILARNKVVGNKMSQKTIPSLECQGIAFAAEVLVELVQELCSKKTVVPINLSDVYVYTDSMVSLSWIRAYFTTHEKMQKRSVFILNRLKQIGDACADTKMTFRYVEGRDNPADCVTRPISYNVLKKTCYLTGPKFLSKIPHQPDFEVTVPNPVCSSSTEYEKVAVCSATVEPSECSVSHTVEPRKYSSFNRLARVVKLVLKFIHNLRIKCGNIKGACTQTQSLNFYALACNNLIRTEQQLYLPEVSKFFNERQVPTVKIPNLILQMNLFKDEHSIIRIKGKFKSPLYCPILLHDKSYLTELLIRDLHERVSHAGVYVVLRELRHKFWVLRGFATVRRILKQCITCRKRNERPIKLNQHGYRDFRSSPPKTPFSSVFLDYIGPINVRFDDGVKKVWLLIITCLWSRAISLKICLSAATEEFLHSLQMHIYEFGLFQHCLSDLGSQITAGTRIVTDFLDDFHCVEFFEQHGIKSVTFEHYAKGNSSLGSLVEVCVKQTKFLIVKSIGKVILTYRHFQLLICKTQHLLNRRPVAFQNSLRQENVVDEVPTPITPEVLLFGRDLISVNVIPDVQPNAEDCLYTTTTDEIRDGYRRLQKVFANLQKLYHEEFLVQLLSQAIDKRDRYKPVSHKVLGPGDIVLLVEPLTKQTNYPLGVVKSVKINELGEVTSAMVLKGKTREVVYRHASSLILLLHAANDSDTIDDSNPVNTVRSDTIANQRKIPQRRAAKLAKSEIYTQCRENLV